MNTNHNEVTIFALWHVKLATRGELNGPSFVILQLVGNSEKETDRLFNILLYLWEIWHSFLQNRRVPQQDIKKKNKKVKFSRFFFIWTREQVPRLYEQKKPHTNSHCCSFIIDLLDIQCFL